MPKLGVRRKKSSPKLIAVRTPAFEEGHDASSPEVFGTPSCLETSPLLASNNNQLLPPQESATSSNRSSPGRASKDSSRIDMNPAPAGLSTPLIPKAGTRNRSKGSTRYEPTDWDDSLPYGGKVYLARKKKPDTWLCIAVQVFLVAFSVGLVYYAWYHTDHMHFHATKMYGHLGHTHAQALTAEKYLHGKGVARNHSEAMAWYKKAAAAGHPHSSYNLAVGHLQGLDVGLKPGEAHELIRHAASNGVVEAADVLAKVCSRGRCDQ